MNQTQNSKYLSKFFAVLLYAGMLLSLTGAIGGVLSALCAIVLFWRAHRKEQAQQARLEGGFAAFASSHHVLSEKELTEILIREELQRIHSDTDLVCKKSVKKCRLYTGLFIFLNWIILCATYATNACWLLCELLLLLYGYLLRRNGTVNTLCTLAQKAPDTPIRTLIQEQVRQQPKKFPVVSSAAFLLSLLLFFSLYAEPNYRVEQTANGITLTDYDPAVSFFPVTEALPGHIDGQAITTIGDGAFSNITKLEKVILPDTITTIEPRAFEDCTGLTSVQFGKNVTAIGAYSFRNCSALEAISVPTGVTEIRANTFEGCSRLTDVALHDAIFDIHAAAFMDCTSLEQIRLPKAITEIHASTFQNCNSLRTIDIPEGVFRIAAHAFQNCGTLYTVSAPNSLQEIGSSAFRQCSSLTKIELPTGVSIDERAFKESPTEITYRWDS